AEPAAGEPPPAGAEPGAVYTAVVRLAEGAAPPPSDVLFISLHDAASGPPAAVRRVAGPTFPLEVTLSARDSMLGRPLPKSGRLAVRLDSDGNASTREPQDLAAEIDARQGATVELTLGPR
ncbi:MAG: hypothetical protein ACRD2Z_05060, partial [Thermoanaerobaculia bacterium]